MMRQIVLATTNAGKVRELAAALAATGCEVLGLERFPAIGEVAETGATFAENALLKAAHAAAATGLVAIADDSGLLVDALGGRPGVRSARFADDYEPLAGETRDARNIRKLLRLLAGQKNRAAHFETCMAAAAPGGATLAVSGRWDGEILESPRGENGFGYDPVFFDPLLGQSAAQLNSAQKNRVSHRGRALGALLAAWPAFLQKAK